MDRSTLGYKNRCFKRQLFFLLLAACCLFLACGNLTGDLEDLRPRVEEPTNLFALDGTVIISGIAQVGKTLTANTASLNGSGTITYQWKRELGGTIDIGSNSKTYIITLEDLGSNITVTVTFSGNTGSVISDPIGPVGLISIEGDPWVGEVLSIDVGNFLSGRILDYQWWRNSIPISINSATYTLTAADLGSEIAVTVAPRDDPSNSVISTPIGPVIWPPLKGMVSIEETALVWDTLTANTSGLEGAGAISYQWNRGENAIIGADSNTYTVQSDDEGHRITVTVSRLEKSGVIESNETDIVPAPAIEIIGTSLVGDTLTAKTINLGGTPSYQWKQNGTAVIGSGSTYIVQFTDVGSNITVTVTSTDVSGSITSNQAGPVPAPTVEIIGTFFVGDTLTAKTINLGGTPSYQWKQNGAAVIGSDSTYIVQFTDADSAFTVTVSCTGVSDSITSVQVGPVPQPSLVISGTAQAGETLTAVVASVGGIISNYQWKSDGRNIGDNSNTYLLTSAEAGSNITVTASITGVASSITSDQIGPVTVQEAFIISFAQLEDLAPDIAGPTLRIIGSTAETYKAITVANPGQYESGSIKWFFSGSQITGSAVSGSFGETLTLSSGTYSNIGIYSVTVEVKKDGKFYSKAINFEVKL